MYSLHHLLIISVSLCAKKIILLLEAMSQWSQELPWTRRTSVGRATRVLKCFEHNNVELHFTFQKPVL
jgi:hypothetical protein